MVNGGLRSAINIAVPANAATTRGYDPRAASSACGVSMSRKALWPSTGT